MAKRNDWSKLRVCQTRCDGCLFGKDRIVDGARAAEIIRSIRANDMARGYFVCHVHSLRGLRDRRLSRSETSVMCRGFYDSPATSNVLILRLARELNTIVFVDWNGTIVPATEETHAETER